MALERVQQPPPAVLYADSAYRGAPLQDWLAIHGGGRLAIVQQPRRDAWGLPGQTLVAASGFQVLPKRWVVERTHAWLGRNRRLSKDYEGLPVTTEAWDYLGMAVLMVRRLAL